MTRSPLPLLVPILAAAVCCPSRGAAGGGPPPVRVRLASLGGMETASLRAEGPLVAVDGATGETIAGPANLLTLRAAGALVAAGAGRAARIRVERRGEGGEGDRAELPRSAGISVDPQAGRARRIYPGALLLTASGGRLQLVNECSLEEYTVGVLAGECPAAFHLEALKAMAIAARSYTLRRGLKSELCDTTHCQVYAGTGSAAAGLRQAVRETEGLVARYDGEVIEAVYSADCGGFTEANEEAWKGTRPLPYLRPVEDAPAPGAEPYCGGNRSHRWRMSFPLSRLQALLGRAVTAATLEIRELTGSGRVRQVGLSRAAAPAPEAQKTPASAVRQAAQGLGQLTGDALRRLLGPTVLRSLRFEVRHTAGGVELQGRGYGHGVGLCQHGANGMARRGMAFEAILHHYYTGITVEPLLLPAPEASDRAEPGAGSPAPDPAPAGS